MSCMYYITGRANHMSSDEDDYMKYAYANTC